MRITLKKLHKIQRKFRYKSILLITDNDLTPYQFLLKNPKFNAYTINSAGKITTAADTAELTTSWFYYFLEVADYLIFTNPDGTLNLLRRDNR